MRHGNNKRMLTTTWWRTTRERRGERMKGETKGACAEARTAEISRRGGGGGVWSGPVWPVQCLSRSKGPATTQRGFGAPPALLSAPPRSLPLAPNVRFLSLPLPASPYAPPRCSFAHPTHFIFLVSPLRYSAFPLPPLLTATHFSFIPLQIVLSGHEAILVCTHPPPGVSFLTTHDCPN